MLNWVKKLRGTDEGTIAFRMQVLDRDERDRKAVHGMSHEMQRAYFNRMLLLSSYKPTAAFRVWYDRDTQLILANAQWSAWERICNERRAA